MKPRERIMKQYRGVLCAVVACVIASVPIRLDAQPGITRAQCPVENAQVSVSFSGVDTDVAAARSKLDAKLAEIKGLAQEEQFTKFVMQSNSYNISTGYGGGGEVHYQFNGTFTFQVLPADKALDFMQTLAKKGYQANVNVNSYNTGVCAQNSER